MIVDKDGTGAAPDSGDIERFAYQREKDADAPRG
jgi:hypothetical protein